MTQRTTLFVLSRKCVCLIFIFLLCTLVSFSQQTIYPHTLDSVIAYIEKNYAGFSDKVNTQTKKAYQAHTKQAYQLAKQAQSAADYYVVINHWLTFFKDQHLYINSPADTTSTKKARHDDKQVQKSYHKPLFDEENRVNAFFKTLNDSTCYLRIKSFNGSYDRSIDSVIKANLKSIQSTPKLIIDLRGNGGGSDHCISFLQPILYTNPVKNIGVDLLTTPDNTAAWEFLINQYRNKLPGKYLDDALKKIHQGDGKARAFVNFEPDYTGTLPVVWANPAKVAIVIDGQCASATEELLLFARQSKKTKIVGEHSSGVLDYSNVVPRDFSNPPFTLHYPTTRSRRIDAGLGIDNKGILPDIPLTLSTNNWLDELMRKW
jgi:hypothetical protein